MRLNIVRTISGKTQKELEKHCGVNQTAISLCEKGTADYLHYGQKKSIEDFLGIRVDWNTTPEVDPLTRGEIRDMKFFYQTILESSKATENEVKEWIGSFDTSRDAYVEAKKIIDNNVGVRMPKPPEARWTTNEKGQAVADFSHL